MQNKKLILHTDNGWVEIVAYSNTLTFTVHGQTIGAKLEYSEVQKLMRFLMEPESEII